ncbi:MAG: DUF2071 domain-containing protein [Thermoanaerobaculia bacterium]|nr:DUF2071 domain-containing protein [Thermoanaerobaculia bacterium]
MERSPRLPWRQSWCDLAFLHWELPLDTVRGLVPEPLQVREWEGKTWVGLVPFRMERVGWRRMPGLPGHSRFPEINVRVYVELDGQPGVWFLSLEAPPRLVVWTARRFFHLPYVRSEIRLESGVGDVDTEATKGYGDAVAVASCRRGAGSSVRPRLEATYRPTSPPFEAAPGSLEAWLTDLDRLYSRDPQNRLLTAKVDHPAWRLQQAEVRIERNELLSVLGLDVRSDQPAHCLFSRRIDVRMSSPDVVGRCSPRRH